MSRSMFCSVLLLLLARLACPLVAAGTVYPLPNFGNSANMNTLILDTEGHGGAWEASGGGFRTEGWLPGAAAPFFSRNSLQVATSFVPLAQGTPYLIRAQAPGGYCAAFEHVGGGAFDFGTTSASPVFILAAPFSQVGLPAEPSNRTVTGEGDGTAMDFQVFVGDSVTTSTIGFSIGWHPTRDLPVTVRVDYLGGSNLEHLGFHEWAYEAQQAAGGEFPPIYWGDSPGAIHAVAPDGPISITIGAAGYLPSVAHFDAHQGRVYRLRLVLVPDPNASEPGISPAGVPASPAVLEMAAAEALFGTCTPAANLAGPTDANSDGVRDAADMVRLKSEE